MSSITITVSEDKPAALVSFPQGIPWHLEEMNLNVFEKAKSGSGSSKRKRKCIVVGSLGNVEYIGCNFGESSERLDSSCFAIALLDEKSGLLEVIPTDHPYTLRPNIGIQSTRRNQSNLSNYERKQSLTEAFGSKKKQRAQRAASSNIISSENISGVGAIESAMNGLNEAAAIAGTETVLDGATKAQEFNRAQLLPAYDLSTDDVTKVYPIEALIPSAVMRCLGDVFDTMYAEYIPGASLLEHFDTKLKVMSSLKSISLLLFKTLSKDASKAEKYTLREDTAKAEKYMTRVKSFMMKLVYLSYTMLFYKLIAEANRNTIAKDDLGEKFNISPIISRHFCDIFATSRKLPDGRNCIAGSKLLMDKLLLHTIVVGLSCSEFELDLKCFAADLSMTANMLATRSRELGCAVSKGNIASLKAPLKFPNMKKKVAGSSR